jgi:FkbM family methyltransferase
MEAEPMLFRTPNGNEATFLLRPNTNDLNTTYSICSADEYGLRGLELSGWALDIGSYTGVVAVCLALDNPGLEVVAVEPVPENALRVAEHARMNGVADRVSVLEVAAGARGTWTVIRYGFRTAGELDHHAWVGHTSLVYETPPVEQHEELEVPCLDLPALIAERGCAPAFIKVDCEGGEWGILQDLAGSGCPLINGEWHPVCGRGEAAELVDAFLAAGYRVDLDGPAGGPGLFVATRP